MKSKFSLQIFTLLLSVIAISIFACKQESEETPPETQNYHSVPSNLTTYRGQLENKIKNIASDAIFEHFVDNLSQSISLIMLEPALNDASKSFSFFSDSYNVADTAKNIISLYPLMTQYGFTQATLDKLSTVNENITTDLKILENTYLIGLNSSERYYVLNGALDVFLDSPEATCCEEYRHALIQCARSAQNYLNNVWGGVVSVFGGNYGAGAVGIMAAGNPFQIANDVYPCVRAADAIYSPCCN